MTMSEYEERFRPPAPSLYQTFAEVRGSNRGGRRSRRLFQAAEIFTCGGLGYAMHDGKVERACTAPVTTHWTKLAGHSSALVSYIDEPDGLHVAVTTKQGMTEKAPVERFETVLAAGQSAAISIPRGAGEAPARIVLSNAGGHLHIAEPPASVSAQ